MMRRAPARLLPVAILAIFGCGDANDPVRVLDRTAEAMGGRDRVLGTATLALQGEGENFNPGQNALPDADLPMFRVTEFRRTIDFENGRWLQDQVRTAAFVTANTAPTRQVLGVDGGIAYNIAPNGDAIRVAASVAAARMRELHFHPIGFLRAALAPGARLRYEARDDAHDMVHLDLPGSTQAMLIDRATRLPVAIRAPAAHPNLGDVGIETRFADYAETEGVRLPMRITSMLDRFTTADIRLTAASPGADASGLAAPEAARAAAAPAASVNVTVEDVAPGVWYLAGQSHHSVAIEFADHLLLVEAPQSEARTLAVIAKARELRPEKPVRYVVSTHHHFDHSAGIRAAISEGLTIVAHAGAESFLRDIARRPHTLEPDALARTPRELQLEPVDRLRVFQDATRTVEVHTIEGNAHAGTLLMVVLPAERLLIEADVYSPPAADAVNPPPAVFAPNLVENMRRLNLPVMRIVPIHGRIVPQRMLEAAAAAAAAGTVSR